MTNHLLTVLLFTLLLPLDGVKASPNDEMAGVGLFREVPLRSGVYLVPLRGTLTVIFPDPISIGDLSGLGFTIDPSLHPGEILIDHTSGDSHLSLSPLRDDFGPLNLNVLSGSELVCLQLIPAIGGERPLLGLKFISPQAQAIDIQKHSKRPPNRYAELTPGIIRSFLDITRLSLTLDPQGLGQLTELTPDLSASWRSGETIASGSLEISLKRVLRDDRLNALGMAGLLKNRGDSKILLSQENFRIEVKDHTLTILSWELPKTIESGEELSFAFVLKSESGKISPVNRFHIRYETP